MKKTGLLLVIIWGLCAIFWSIRVVYEIISRSYPTTSFLLVLEILCAILFIVAFIVQLKRYTKSQKED